MDTTPARWRRLDTDSAEHLYRLTSTWQLVADLTFADLLLLVPVPGADPPPIGADPAELQIVAQQRPYTARTLYPEDLVGQVVDVDWHPWVGQAWREAKPVFPSEPTTVGGDEAVRVAGIPVRHRGDVVAVLAIEAADKPDRATGRLEAAYLDSADALLTMITAGDFPFAEANDLITSPRVGDGLILVDGQGLVTFTSPNAVSAFRRIGTSAVPLQAPPPERVRVLAGEALASRHPVEYEIEEGGAVVDLRVVPLMVDGRWSRVIALCREVTDLRRKDRLISLREATIREVHHRVKNNLQTVASLLRLQARRMRGQPEAAAALEESVRRVAAIALVHETLTEEQEGTVELDEVARRVVRMLEGSMAREQVRIRLHAEQLRVNATVATPVAVVLNELVQNAIEHGLQEGPGVVTVELLHERGGPLVLTVSDDGPGVDPTPEPEDAPRRGGSGLGLPLVRTLVQDQLGGSFTLELNKGTGSRAVATVPVR